MRKINQIIFTILIIFIFSFVLIPANAYASSGRNIVINGLNVTANTAGLQNGSTPKDMVTNILGYVLGFLGIIVFINIIFAGYQWIMAGGNEETISKAKNRIKNSVIGLIIIIGAYLITSNLFSAVKNVINEPQ
ncbi:MAG: hypothetical protein PHH83_03065 [Patescibacteria group bacterium]|nr:hypothetical protein [Patescibacteria group bacterium]